MILGKLQIVLTEAVGIEPHIGIAAKGQHRLFGVGRREGGGKLPEPGVVEVGQLVTDLHEAGKLSPAQLPGAFHQNPAFLQKIGPAVGKGTGIPPWRVFEIELLGGREKNDHGGNFQSCGGVESCIYDP